MVGHPASFGGNSLRLIAEDEGQGLGVVEGRIRLGRFSKVGGRNLEAFFLESTEALCRGSEVIEMEPLFGPGGDRLVDREKLRLRGDDIHIQDSRRIAGPDHGAGVVGVDDFLEDDVQVRLLEIEDAFHLGDTAFGRHS